MQEIRSKIRALESTRFLLPYSGAIRQAVLFQPPFELYMLHFSKLKAFHTTSMTVSSGWFALSNFASGNATTEPRKVGVSS
jgi:hypothetical protein